MRVLAQVVSASSCERNWSVHGHIHSKVRNKLAPATTQKLVYVYANSNFVSEPRTSGDLHFFDRMIKKLTFTDGRARPGPTGPVRTAASETEAEARRRRF